GSQAVLVILTMGLLVPFITGEFDISIVGVNSMALVLVGWLNVVHHWPIGYAVLVALGAGAGIGLINAAFIVGLGVDSIVVTLGMGTLLLGAADGINPVTTGGISDALVNVVQHQILDIPLGFYFGALLTLLLWYVLSYTPLGRYMY